jgi:MFS family permease
VGVLLTAMGLGSVAGAMLSARMIHRYGEQAAVSAGLVAMALGTGLLIYPRLWLGLAVAPLIGFGVAVTTVAFGTLRQRVTPGPLMGRVSTATDMLVLAPQTLSIGLGALVVSVVDFRWLFALLAAGAVLRPGPGAERDAAAGVSAGPLAIGQDEP